MAAEGKSTEPKIEPKPEIKEPTTAVGAIEENPEPPLKYKTLVLKVSVHCEGCKRKVIKILKNIEGVYKVEIDLRQQKVSVIGNVDSETLIKKLLKAGKHAELWPEIKSQKKKSKSKNKDKDKEKQSDQESEDEQDQDNKETVKNEVPIIQDPSKSGENGKIGEPIAVSAPAGDKKTGEDSEGGVADKPPGGGSGGGKKKKKKKNKGHNGNNDNNNQHADESEHCPHGAPAGTGLVSQGFGPYVQGPVTSVANHSPPRHHVYHYPPHYYAPPPVYSVNYNTTYPSTSYGASVYPQTYSYAYMHPGTAGESPPSDVDTYASQPSDTFEIFSDENPNACSVM